MPVQAVKDWLSYFERIADELAVNAEITENEVFHIQVSGEPPAVGKVRYSNYLDRQEDHIWQRFDREQERIADESDERVFAIQLDVRSKEEFNPQYDHFILITEDLLRTELSDNGDVHIDTEQPGDYDAPFSGNSDNWNALFEYLTSHTYDFNVGDLLDERFDGSRFEHLDGETDYLGQFLIDRYRDREGKSWTQLENESDQTSKVIRKTVQAIVDNLDRIGDYELTTLHDLCHHRNSLSVDEKRKRVRGLDLPEQAIQEIVELIDNSIGSIGGHNYTLYVGGQDEAFPDVERELHHYFARLVQEDIDPDEQLQTVEQITALDFHSVQSGRLSPVIHYLSPTVFPVINNRTIGGMEAYFGYDIDPSLENYLSEREKYMDVRDKFDFAENFRDLDWFFIWADQGDNSWTRLIREDRDRNYWQAQPGTNDSRFPEVLWPIWRDRNIISVGWEIGPLEEIDEEGLDPQEKNFALRIKPGDVVVAKRGHEPLLGIGVATPKGYEDVSGTEDEIEFETEIDDDNHPSIRHVQWAFTVGLDSEIDTGYWDLRKQFDNSTIVRYRCFNELREKLTEFYDQDVIPELKDVEELSVGYQVTAEQEYFVLKTGSDEYADDPTSQYQFKEGIPGSRQIQEAAGNAQCVFFEDGEFYGVGNLGDVEEDQARDGTQYYFVDIEDYEEIGPVLEETVSDAVETTLSPGYGIINISEQDYATIVEGMPTETYRKWWATHDDVIEATSAIAPPSNLVFPNGVGREIRSRIQSAISNGKHVILTGPPGTGKTELARHVALQYVGDNHEMVTATADWSTFDTIGGYRPQRDQQLAFHEGVFLDRFQEETSNKPTCEWLIIDELNRADIDKAFGSLLSALTGQTIRLPFDEGEGDEKEAITLIGDPQPSDTTPITSSNYFIPEDWRLIGTMNTYDKTSLYQLSFAFMRRFAFIPVPVPSEEDIHGSLIQKYTDRWFDEFVLADDLANEIAELWITINDIRKIGPAIIRDLISDYTASDTEDVTDPIIMYVMPQLEGLSKTDQREFVRRLEDFDGDYQLDIDAESVAEFVRDYFDVEPFPDDE